jgi:4,5-DOPA dioxygenase extradiol
MQRRQLLSSATLISPLMASALSQFTTNANAATTSKLKHPMKTLKSSPKMPVLFVGHGSPMNAIDDNVYRRSWQVLGQEFGEGKKYPTPSLILCISAHWITRGWWLTGMQNPKTIHDFGGFPQELFAQQYPAPGAPAVAEELSKQLVSPIPKGFVGVDMDKWGFDHGTWSVLKPMFPNATIPVMQLSMDYSRAPVEHLMLGQQLRELRNQGVLIVGSGNIVHNLRMAGNVKPYDWNIEFDAWTAAQMADRNYDELANFLKLGNLATMAHPTYDHYLPLLYSAGAVDSKDNMTTFNDSFTMGSISMRSVIWS